MGEDHEDGDIAEQDPDEAVAGDREIELRLAPLQHAQVSGEGELEADIRDARAADGNPGRQQRDGGDDGDEPGNIRRQWEHKDERGIAERGAKEATGQAKRHLLCAFADRRQGDDEAGDHACGDAGPVEEIEGQVADHDRRRRLGGKTLVIGIGEGIRFEEPALRLRLRRRPELRQRRTRDDIFHQ